MSKSRTNAYAAYGAALLASAIAIGGISAVGFPAAHAPTHVAEAAPIFGANARASRPDFAAVVDAVRPAVVSVSVKSRAAPQTMAKPMDGHPLAPFFKEHQKGPGSSKSAPQESTPQGRQPHRPLVEAVGSAFFITPDGYAVTGHHVVDGAEQIELVTDDGESLAAKLVGSDARTDVALLKVDGRKDFPFVGFASKRPRIGDWVVAMGNPFGLGGTVTAGIVSGEGRNIGLGPYDDYLQIDAAVNKGNSGGPTFDLYGKVVGVNSAIIANGPSGGSVGIAFAIPATTVQKVAAQLKDKGHVERGWLGVQIQSVTAEIADSLGLENGKGALVSEVEAQSPAAAAGLKLGDIITHVNATEIKDANHMTREVAELAPNAMASLGILREGSTQTAKVTLGTLKVENEKEAADQATQPKPDIEGDGAESLGLVLEPAAKVMGADASGLAVTDIEPNGRAIEFGIMVGDVVMQVGGKGVSTSEEFTRAIAAAKAAGRRHALLLVRRNDDQRFIAVPVAAG